MVDIAMKWTKVLRTGGLGVRFMAVDRSTVMFNMQNGKEVTEVIESLKLYLQDWLMRSTIDSLCS